MNRLLNTSLIIVAALFSLSVLHTDTLAQGQAAQDYNKGREAFLTFTPEGFQNAISLYKKAIAADPNYAAAYAGLGELYSFQGYYRYVVKADYEQYYIDSYENMKKALKINPNLEPVQVALAYTYLHLSDEKSAIRTAQGILAKDPNNAEALYILWEAQGGNPNNPGIQKALEINPNLVPALIGLGTAYYEKRRFAQADNYFRRAEKIAPSPELHNFLGNALIYQGNYSGAIAQFQRALEMNPNYAAAYMNMGIAYFYNGSINEAINAEKKSISLNPNVPDAYYFLAQSYDRTNNYALAKSTYNKFLQVALGQDQYSIYVKTAQQRLAALSGK